MKKILSLTIILLFIVNTVLFAFETDFYKVNDKGWKNIKQSRFQIFTLEDSKEFIDPETEQKSESDIYILIGIIPFNEMTPDDYSKKNAEDFKNDFQRYIQRDINKQKKEIMEDLEKGFPFLDKAYLQKKVDKRFERNQINSYSVKKLGKFQSYYIDFYNENFNVEYYSLHTLNRRYQIQIYYHKDVSKDKLKPAYDFVNSFEPKDVAPTKLNMFLYGSGLKITLVILLLLSFVIFKIYNSKRS